MTDIAGVGTVPQISGSGASDPAREANEVDYDAFLTLLVAQLKNQDPTEPMDSTQYLAQLASFSSVEQQIKTNDQLGQILAAEQIGQASGLIGKHVAVDDSGATLPVVSVTLTDNGVLANLEGGFSIPVGPGLQIFNEPQQPTQ